MIDHLWLVAAREFRQIAGTKGFWITLLILPLAIAAGPIVSRFIDKSDTQRVMLVDRSGREEGAIRRQLDLDHARDVLGALGRYAARHHLETADRFAPWAQNSRWYSDADAARFIASGGAAPALARMKRVAAADTPAFEEPKRKVVLVPVPPVVASGSPARLDALLQPLLHPADKDAQALDAALYVPADFGRGGTGVRLWANSRPDPDLVQLVQGVLTRDLRSGYLRANGLSPAAMQTADALAPAIAVSAPPPGGGGTEQVVIRSLVPLALAYMLLMSLMLSGQWMLQGLIEERSNKLLETVLACVSPHELMYGKLVGSVAAGLTMIAVWVGCALAAGYLGQGAIADIIRPALAPLTSPWTIAAMIFYFVAGYLIVSMIFLVIGAMSDSMRDAQSYLMPVILAIMMPILILMQVMLRGGGGAGVTAMTWFPLYTPFTMLARLGTGVPLWEVLGTCAMLVVVIAVELVLLGRIFRASLLRAGQKPNLAALGRLMRREEA
jgi:ABC-2 type transport system permease protein